MAGPIVACGFPGNDLLPHACSDGVTVRETIEELVNAHHLYLVPSQTDHVETLGEPESGAPAPPSPCWRSTAVKDDGTGPDEGASYGARVGYESC